MTTRGEVSRRVMSSARFLACLALLGLVGCSTPPPAAGIDAETVQSAPGDDNLPGLKRIAWEGGPQYWEQFSHAQQAGWTDPGFFPIVAWFNSVSTDEEAQFDKSVGINTYIGMPETTPYSMFEDNDMYYIGPRLNDSYTEGSVNWVGQLLGDEMDGQFPDPVKGQAYMESRAAEVTSEFFKYANYTQIVIGNDMKQADSEKYVNAYTDAVSMDMYWYTIPFCTGATYRNIYIVPVEQDSCRTASSYGKATKALRMRDAVDGKLQPVWQFVENYSGSPGSEPFVAAIKPEQLEGAVMSSLINEARGILYFNQSLAGDCRSGNVFREAQVTKDFCGADTVAGAARVNAKIHELAPVLNTQSYVHEFGPGLQTMLKADTKHAYIFAMLEAGAETGEKEFKLPSQISGRNVQVLFEDREVAVDADGTFADEFTNEASYHIYKVEIG